MSLKQEIETWVQAITHYDNNEFDESLKAFDSIADTSKILFNSGVIHATLGEHDKAVEYYQRAVRLDQYLAVAYFQQGVSNFLMEDFEEALANFNDTLLYLRGNTYIDYEQLGLKFKLFSCEVLFNRGMCYIYLQQKEAGMGDLSYAAKEKVTPDHDVIDEAIREQAEGYTVFSIPVGIVYRPNSAKVKNLKTKNYLGKARLIASSDNNNNTSTGFASPEITRMKAAVVDLSRDGRPLDSISFAASNLVKPDIKSRTRQRSEPPINRNVFPPTPPPDPDQPVRPVLASTQTSPPTNLGRLTGRANSVKSPPARPEPLDLSKQSPSKPALNKELPRLGTTRTASEPGGPRRNHYSSHSDQDPARRSAAAFSWKPRPRGAATTATKPTSTNTPRSSTPCTACTDAPKSPARRRPNGPARGPGADPARGPARTPSTKPTKTPRPTPALPSTATSTSSTARPRTPAAVTPIIAITVAPASSRPRGPARAAAPLRARFPARAGMRPRRASGISASRCIIVAAAARTTRGI
ncbi:MAG: hypothetical protein FRX48_03831 [Lasallia pustulata]|uniref:Uncharacterized protein n=1 Tax=Lasallia pustulata TaxID=136370 RepID=A0A5M8PTC6_9LECA|nr:MAG: hypothetical protein FRX48_03831 [Lasallia pustulata]